MGQSIKLCSIERRASQLLQKIFIFSKVTLFWETFASSKNRKILSLIMDVYLHEFARAKNFAI